MSINSASPWWDRDGDPADPVERLSTLYTQQRRLQEMRYVTMRKYVTIYEYGYKATERAVSSSREKYLDDQVLTFNAAQNALDTVVAQVCTPKVAPMALTDGGKWLERDRAKQLTHALEGQFDECNVDELTEDVVRDFGKCGLGALKVWPDHEQVKLRVERVLPDDVLFDEAESRYRQPRCVYHRYFLDRYVARELYAKAGEGFYGSIRARKEGIESAKGVSASSEVEDNPDLIEVVEAWHLPSAIGAKDGRHTIIVLDSVTLVDEAWDGDRFPFVFYCPKRSHTGMWGIPGMRQLASGQREYEKVTAKLQRHHQKMGGAHFLVQRSAKMEKRKLTNDAGDIWEYDGPIPPQSFTPAPANEQAYQWHAMVPELMVRYLGTSQFAAQSQVPAGLSDASGKALQVFSDAENKRFVEWYRGRERFAVDLAWLMASAASDLAEKHPEFSARHRSTYGYEQIKWKDVLGDLKSLVLRVFPVSSLSQEPSAKFAQLEQLLNAGAITVEQFKRLYGLPDLTAETDIDCADYEVIDKNLDWMVTKGKYISPEPFDNLELIKVRGGKFYNMLRRYDVPEDRMELVRQYIADAQNMLQAAKDQAAADAAMNPAPPVGPGMPPDGMPPVPPDGGGLPMPTGPEGPPMMPPPMPVAA